MPTFLFDAVVFGPITSRRLGHSLGVNLLPTSGKLCNFNCIYCECGWTENYRDSEKVSLPTTNEIAAALEEKLKVLSRSGQEINAITFAGNGEPTLHPNLDKVMDATIDLRNQYYPEAKIAVLSNGTRLNNTKVIKALNKADQCILKLDAGNQNLFNHINQPVSSMQLSDIVDSLSQFDGQVIIQSLFLKGTYKGRDISNIHLYDVKDWLDKLEKIQPSQVMLYTLDRDTPAKGIERVSQGELSAIAMLATIRKFNTYIYD